MSISYRSDREADFRCLEQYLLSGVFGNLPDAWRHQAQHDLATLQGKYDEVASAIGVSAGKDDLAVPKITEIELPTRFDSPSQYRVLTRLVERVRAAARHFNMGEAKFPHYACIPTGLVNARAARLPCASRPFLLFDSQLLLYCHLFAKAFARCLPLVDRAERLSFSVEMDHVRARISDTPELAERLADLLLSYTVKGAPFLAKSYLPEDDYIHLIDIVRDGMELFVVAHEFGHVYADHLGDVLQRLGLGSEEINGESDAHRKEHEADILALLLTLQAMADRGYDAPLSYVGIELFFVSLDMAARTRHIVANGTDASYADRPSGSHPSITARRRVTAAALEVFVPERDVRGAMALAATYTEIASVLWQHAKRDHFRVTESATD